MAIQKYKIVLQQDECAPDAKQIFKKEFEEYFGITLEFFTSGRVPVDLGDTFIYLSGDFKISNEIGIWKVEELEQ